MPDPWEINWGGLPLTGAIVNIIAIIVLILVLCGIDALF